MKIWLIRGRKSLGTRSRTLARVAAALYATTRIPIRGAWLREGERDGDRSDSMTSRDTTAEDRRKGSCRTPTTRWFRLRTRVGRAWRSSPVAAAHDGDGDGLRDPGRGRARCENSGRRRHHSTPVAVATGGNYERSRSPKIAQSFWPTPSSVNPRGRGGSGANTSSGSVASRWRRAGPTPSRCRGARRTH